MMADSSAGKGPGLGVNVETADLRLSQRMPRAALRGQNVA